MADNNFQDFGQQVSDAVQSALVSGDFSSIKNIVNSTLNTVLTKTISLGKPFGGVPPNYGSPPPPPYDKRTAPPPPYEKHAPPPPPPPPPYGKYTAPQYGKYTAPPPPYYNARPAPPVTAVARHKKVPYSGASGVVLMVFGIIGIVVTGTISLIAAVMAAASGIVSFGLGSTALLYALITIASMLPLLIASIVATARGGMICGRAKRYKNYWRMMEGKVMCRLDKFALSVRKPLSFVKKEIGKMIDVGMFPQGHLDEGQDILMLGDVTYRKYLDEQEKKKQDEQQRAAKKKADDEQDPSSPAAVIAEGRACIKQIREANDVLSGVDISEKLTRLEQVTTKIFMNVEQDPEKLPAIRRFMSYYLPTTIKLVTSYQGFEAQPIQGENITQAKGEILEMLDTINIAFETLLDSLFEDDAMDISTDISALKSMLAQEGLTGNEFKQEE